MADKPLSGEVPPSGEVFPSGKMCVGGGDVDVEKKPVLPQLSKHRKCIAGPYAGNSVVRRLTDVDPEKVNWNVEYLDYETLDWTDPSVLGKDGKAPVWADPTDPKLVDFTKRALYGEINFDGHGHPLNPVGRTGITGRGLLGKWGPNSAADPLFTRWKRDEKGNRVLVDGVPVLQVAVIKRKDTNEWALPGGMVDYGEEVSLAARREFGEEALAGYSPEEVKKITDKLKQMMDTQGVVIYKGYVDDPRNTDNAWMVTTAFWVHDKTGHVFDKFELHGDEVETNGAVWMDVCPDLNMYASHADWVHAARDLAIAEHEQDKANTLATTFQGSWSLCVGVYDVTRDIAIVRECCQEGAGWCALNDRFTGLLDDLLTAIVGNPSCNRRDALMEIGDVIHRLIQYTSASKETPEGQARAFQAIWDLCSKRFLALGGTSDALRKCFEIGCEMCDQTRPCVDLIIKTNATLLDLVIASKYSSTKDQLKLMGERIGRTIAVNQ